MGYALFGIPLCLVMMATTGRLFTRVMKYLWSFIRRFYYTGHCRSVRKKFNPAMKAVMEKLHTQNGKDGKSPEDGEPPESPAEVEAPEIMEIYEVDDEFNLPPIIAVIILLGYVLFGGFMYTIWEEWDYIESFYFIFISISTIGFGDVLPAHPRYFLASSIYILVGLSLVAMVINSIMEVVVSMIKDAKKKVIDVSNKIGLDFPKEVFETAEDIAEAEKEKSENEDKASDNGEKRKNSLTSKSNSSPKESPV